MSIKNHLNEMLSTNKKVNESSSITAMGVSDDALVLLSAISDGNNFFVKLNSNSDSMKALENIDYVKNSKLTKAAKDFLKTKEAKARILKIGN